MLMYLLQQSKSQLIVKRQMPLAVLAIPVLIHAPQVKHCYPVLALDQVNRNVWFYAYQAVD
jgi:hypothetical protein